MSWWNWKGAVLSALCRAAIFLSATLPAGAAAGGRAATVEFTFRVFVSGVLASATQRCARLPLGRRGIGAAVLAIAAAGHLAEFAVHRSAGTPRVTVAVAGSIAFTLVTTSFNLFAMRRGVLVTGAGCLSLLDDLRLMPRTVAAFFRTLWASRRFI
jgi:hypothetical protein